MYVNESNNSERKEEKALNELRASPMPIHIHTLNLKHRSLKRKTIIGFPCRSQRTKEKKKESTPVRKKIKGAKWLMVCALIFKQVSYAIHYNDK
jgi:hypothetical protein